MTAAALLSELRAMGATVMADGERLALDAPAGVLTPALLDRLRSHKRLILAHLAADEPAVAWRAVAMRARHPYAPGRPLPFLTVRDVPRGGDGCHSCGEPVQDRTGVLAVRCGPCIHAGQLVTTEYMNGGQTA